MVGLRRRRKGEIDLALALMVVVIWAMAFARLATSSTLVRPLMPGCPFRILSGLPCPACGTTRALLALSHLQPLSALAYNPLTTLVALTVLAAGLASLALEVRGYRIHMEASPRLVRWTLPLAVALNWAYLLASLP